MWTIPNFITLLNLICGVFGIALVMQERTVEASVLILIAGVMDVLDGLVARKLGQTSNIGKDLDSLADLISFGVLPGLLMMNYIQELALARLYNEATVTFSRAESMNEPLVMWKYIGLLIPVAAAIRLAKFNNDPRQSKHFFGIPTPMSALFVASIASMIFVFSIDPNDTKHLKEVAHVETLAQNDRIFMKVADLGEDNASNYWKAEVKELSDSGILLQQGVKKYRLPVAEMGAMIAKGQVFVKSSGFFNAYFYTLTGMILLSVVLSILMISELGVLAIKKLPSAIWKNIFLGGWLVIVLGGSLLHWGFVPNFSHPEGTSWLIRFGLNKPIVALLSALPFALVFHLIFSLIYFTFKAQENEV